MRAEHLKREQFIYVEIRTKSVKLKAYSESYKVKIFECLIKLKSMWEISLRIEQYDKKILCSSQFLHFRRMRNNEQCVRERLTSNESISLLQK